MHLIHLYYFYLLEHTQMKHNIFLKVILISLIFLSACSKDSETSLISSIPIDIKIERLEQILFDMKESELKDWLKNHKNIKERYFRLLGSPSDTVIIKSIIDFKKSKHNISLLQDVAKAYEDFFQVESEIKQLFQHIKYYYPECIIPKIYTFVSGYGSYGFGSDLYYERDTLIIGLDFFCANAVTLRPAFPTYMLKRMRREYLTASMALLLSQKFNEYNPKDETLLADMLYYGKSYQFVKEMIPSLVDSVVIGYTAKEWSDCHTFTEVIWAHFIEKDLFYEKRSSVKSQYVSERPNVSQIGRRCPGRIGRWLGWKIVQHYQKQNSQKITEIMKQKDAQYLFMNSGFKP